MRPLPPLDSPSIPDEDLIGRFVTEQDEMAFAALVARHGPAAWSICRRVLVNSADAEDAWQATFLVLARRAVTIRDRRKVGAWVCGVARKVARKRRSQIAWRVAQERPIVADPPAPEQSLSDLRRVLDEELAALPSDYRAALVKCGLEGKSREEAARELGWTMTVLRGRLDRGRAYLRDRLRARGVEVGLAFLAAVFVDAAVPGRAAAAVVTAARSVAAGESPSACPAVVNLFDAFELEREESMSTTWKVVTAGLITFGLAAAWLFAAQSTDEYELAVVQLTVGLNPAGEDLTVYAIEVRGEMVKDIRLISGDDTSQSTFRRGDADRPQVGRVLAAASGYQGADGRRGFRMTWGTQAGGARAGGPSTYTYKASDPVPADDEKFAVTARAGRYKFGEAVIVGKAWGRDVTLTVTRFDR